MESANYKVLLVDDEPDILEFLSYNLSQKGFEVHSCKSGEEAIKLASTLIPHLILMDVMMPGMDGIETCEHLRTNPKLKNTIIAFLSARGEDYSQIAGFEAGGDDYIQKPIRPKVLISRIKALLKRFELRSNTSHEDILDIESIINIGNISIDKGRYLIIKDNKEIVLPKKEFELLVLLVSKPNKVFTRELIFQNVWGANVIVSDRTIDVHIRKLREKLGDDTIKTVKGVGYKYVDTLNGSDSD